MISIVKQYEKLNFDAGEVLRYAGSPKASEEITSVLCECESEALAIIKPQICYSVIDENAIKQLCAFACEGSAFLGYIDACKKAVLFAASIGYGIDVLIARYQSLSVTKAHLINAIGAQQVEELCNVFCKEISIEYPGAKPRFSPGYGGLDLASQRLMFNILDCNKKIGISLGANLLINPSKTVTAIIAIPQK